MEKRVTVDANVQYRIDKLLNLWWWVSYDSSIWIFVPNIKITKAF